MVCLLRSRKPNKIAYCSTEEKRYMSRTKFFIYFGGGFPLYTFGTAKPNVPCDVIPKRERRREVGKKTYKEKMG